VKFPLDSNNVCIRIVSLSDRGNSIVLFGAHVKSGFYLDGIQREKSARTEIGFLAKFVLCFVIRKAARGCRRVYLTPASAGALISIIFFSILLRLAAITRICVFRETHETYGFRKRNICFLKYGADKLPISVNGEL